MNKGDIVIIPFPFTDLTGNKLRPALILGVSDLDIIVAFITTQLGWQDETDVLLSASVQNGLKKNSLLRLSKIATLEKELAIGLLGTVDQVILEKINTNLKLILKIN
jgi:mRNA interferase MazF